MKGYFAVCLFSFLSCILPAQTPPHPRHEVAGTVIDSVTGQPIPGALVILRIQRIARGRDSAAGDASTIQRALTDQAGRFSFLVGPGVSVSLNASRRGYRPERGRDQLFSELESARNVTLPLVPPSAIHGRIVNSDGEPLPDVTVQAIRIEIRNGHRDFQEHASKATDDLGEYRLWHLAPGLYYIKVVGRRACLTCIGTTAQFSETEEAYGPVYYPSAESYASAHPLRLLAGRTVRADFSLNGHKAYKIRGVVRGFTPDDKLSLRLVRGDDPVGNRVSIDISNGAFEASDVTPGTYVVPPLSG